jgi:hypothetical protein
MRHVRLTYALRVASLILLPAAVGAQDWSQPWADPQDRPPRVDVSASAGFLLPTGWSNLVLLGSVSSATGILEQVLTRDLRVEPKREFTGTATYWKGQYGFRTRVGFSRSSLTIGGTPVGTIQSPLEGSASIDIDTWLYDVGGAIGFIDYRPGRIVWPYGFFGLGGVTYNPKTPVSPPLTFIEHNGVTFPPDTVLVIRDSSRQFLLAVDELGVETELAFNFGVGTDLRLPLGPGGVGVRLEVSDHVASSPLGLRVRELSTFGGLGPHDSVRFGLVHHLSATAGVVVHIGRSRSR